MESSILRGKNIVNLQNAVKSKLNIEIINNSIIISYYLQKRNETLLLKLFFFFNFSVKFVKLLKII